MEIIQRMSAPCPKCRTDDVKVLHVDGDFFAKCPTCGAEGLRAEDTYGALQNWRAAAGGKNTPSKAVVLTIVVTLTALAALLLLAGSLWEY